MSEVEKCKMFLEANGFKYVEGDDVLFVDEDDSFVRYDGPASVEIKNNGSEIVFFDDTGDYAHIICDYYALVGFLICRREISFAFVDIRSQYYKSIKDKHNKREK